MAALESSRRSPAIFSGRDDVVRTLIQLGADVNAVSPTGRTPLMVAMLVNDDAVANILIAHGAEPGNPWSPARALAPVFEKERRHSGR